MRQLDESGPGDGSQNRASPNESPRIAVFPKGPTPWRLDWFGDIAFPDRSLRRKQPSVFVHLSRVIDSRFRDDPTVLLSAHSTAPPNFQRRVWVSVGTLPLLRVGDVWRDGQLVVRPDYELEEFTGVQIDQDTTTLIKAGLNLDEGGFLLPLSDHPWHMQCTQSYCLLVHLPDSRRMVIPCMELIRFYFGSSSSLLTKLFLPPLARNSLYGNASLDARSRHLFLELAEKISGSSAADIGRLHLNPLAWRAAALVGASLLKASVAQQPIYPQAVFPFEGKTTLAVAGKWLPFAGQPCSTFLVYSLRSCSHPFPFRSLNYKVHRSAVKPERTTSDSNRSQVHSMRSAARDASNQPLVERDPSNSLAPRMWAYRVEPQFPDLAPKPIWKSRALSISEQLEKQRNRLAAPPVPEASIGEPGSECRIRPIELELRCKIAPHVMPEFLLQVVKELNDLPPDHVDLLTASEHDGWSVPISLQANEDGEIDPQLFSTDHTGSARLRRMSVFAIKPHACLVAIESSPVFMTLLPINQEDPRGLEDVLRNAALDFLKEDLKNLKMRSVFDLIRLRPA